MADQQARRPTTTTPALAARKLYVSILGLIEPPKAKVADGQIPPEDQLVATYRRRLSSVVLS